jgi:flagellar motor protein MotB
MIFFRRWAFLLTGLILIISGPISAQDDHPVEWGFTLGGGGAQALLNPTNQPWAVGYDLRFGWDLRMSPVWRVSVFAARRRFFDDTTTTSNFKFPDPVAKSSQVWTGTSFNFGVRRLFRPASRLHPYLLASSGLTTWEVTDYATGEVRQVPGGNNKDTDYKASEWHTNFGAGLECELSRHVSMWTEIDFFYLTGVGTSFAPSVEDNRSRGNILFSLGITAYFGGAKKKPTPRPQPTEIIEEKETIAEQTVTTPQEVEPDQVVSEEKDLGDNDGDGVPNADDNCPDTPPGFAVNADGCPPDTDGDGVLDINDRCAATPRGAPVDSVGCSLDSDADGIIDLYDRWELTPEGAPVDSAGCPRDSDGDGVFDGLDQCPDTPEHLWVQVDQYGCAIDSDGDGIADHLDKCPDTEAGLEVDSTGCVPDMDGDGVPNDIDLCPDTPDGLAVDESGCLVMTQLGRKLLLFPDYAAGLTRLDHTSQKILNDLAIRLKARPIVTVYIRGYTDNIGEADANKAIAQKRADQARQYLIDQGVAQGRLIAIGLGEVDFIADNATAAGRKRNRRLEFTFER